MTQLQKLRKFLRKEKCLVAFENNVIEYHGMILSQWIKECNDENESLSFIINLAFWWKRTKEGYGFWYSIDKRAKNYE